MRAIEQSSPFRQPIPLFARAAGRVIETTAEHPFYVRNRGWLNAHELREGDELNSHTGTWVRVDEVSDTGCVATVYNFRIAEHHTYFVGAAEWGFSVWAHNKCYGTLPDIADAKHTIFRKVVEDAGYKEVNGKIFKNGVEINAAQVEELTGLYQRHLAKEISPAIDRVHSANPKTTQVEVTVVKPSGEVKSVEKVTVTHAGDGTEHLDLSGQLAKAIGSDTPMPNGYWTEYVHLPQRQVGAVDHPGAHRIIVGQNGEVFYTTNHYQTYTLVAKDWSGWGIFGK